MKINSTAHPNERLASLQEGAKNPCTLSERRTDSPALVCHTVSLARHWPALPGLASLELSFKSLAGASRLKFSVLFNCKISLSKEIVLRECVCNNLGFHGPPY